MPPLRRNWDDSSGAEGRQDGLGVVQFSHTLPLYLGVLPHTILRQIMQRPNPSLLQLLQSFRQKKLLLIYFPKGIRRKIVGFLLAITLILSYN